MTILSGIRIVEFEGLGPAPFCGMHLADLGADVIVIERPQSMGQGKAAIYKRGKRSITLDLKKTQHCDIARRIASRADGLIEGFRPGVMERLGLGPGDLHAENKRLVYGRLTGWGQSGPWARAAGHDINYVALSGAGWYAGGAGDRPVPPPTLVGDIAGGALYLTIGLLAGILKARETGAGCVVDAAIVDGAAHMTGLLMALRAAGGLPVERGQSMLDGAPFYDVYRTACGGCLSIGPLEPKFHAQLLEKLGLEDDPDVTAQFDQSRWPAAREKLMRLFAGEPLSHWCALLEGTDVCFAPVLSPDDAAAHAHMAARQIYTNETGPLQARAAPRFDGVTPPQPKRPPDPGADTADILRDIGLGPDALS